MTMHGPGVGPGLAAEVAGNTTSFDFIIIKTLTHLTITFTRALVAL